MKTDKEATTKSQKTNACKQPVSTQTGQPKRDQDKGQKPSVSPGHKRQAQPGQDQPSLWKRLQASRQQLLRKDYQTLLKATKQAAGPRARKDKNSTGLEKKLALALSRHARRLQQRPAIHFPPQLPVSQHADTIAKAIREHQVVIVAGETGSGKTTQLPKICLQAGLGTTGLIGCTQPRRLAAISMASRVAEELGEPLGQSVGYAVRFDDRSQHDGWIKFMTDGILLQETRSDRWLNAYDAIIIDEAHERSLNIDFLLGYLKQLTQRRPDLKLIITSATIDTERFSAHFDQAPVITVEGRSHPVTVEYQETDADTDLNQAIEQALQQIMRQPDKPAGNDVLVFLPGEREIHDALDYLQKKNWRNTEILPLYARLSGPQQQKIFHPGRQRRVILSTNIAETSLTVPRIGYVIDSGLARISRYNPRSKIQGLLTEPVSQASANQRSGRCGRLGPGLCLRLYSEEDFLQRPAHTDPEIRRTSLASVILQTENLRLGHVDDFPFIDPPDARQISDGYQLLKELNAIDERKQLTAIGRRMAHLPIDVQLARILLAAEKYACLPEALVIASALSVQDPRERPQEVTGRADEAHKRFAHADSDFVAFLNLWREIAKQQAALSRNKFRKWCRDNFLSWRRIQEWQDIHRQLKQILKLKNAAIAATDSLDYAGLHKAILAGFISHVGLHKENGEYLGARNRRFHLFPGSALARRKNPPQWVVAAAIVQTSRVFARNVARIEPDWIEEVAAHALKRDTHDPYWSKKRGHVMAYERISLFGLPIVSKRPMHFGNGSAEDGDTARQLFVRDALAARQLQTRAAFYAHNEKLFRELEAEEHRARRQDLIIDPNRLFDWYDQRLPDTIYSEKSLRQWLATQPQGTLCLSREELLREGASRPQAEQFPETMERHGVRIPLHYHFAPGSADDGVTARLNLAWLNALSANDFEWLVPGLLPEKIEALIRSLPKPARRLLIPAAEYARALAEALAEQATASDALPDFYTALSEHVERMSGLRIEPAQWQQAELPAHLKMRLRVVDERNKTVAEGRDFAAIQHKLSAKARQHFQQHSQQLQQINGALDWVFEDLPEKITLDNGLPAWPAVVDQGHAVGLRFFDNPAAAQAAHRQGVVRLLMLKMPGFFRQNARKLPISLTAEAAWKALDEETGLADAILQAALDELLGSPVARTRQAFDALTDRVKTRLFKQAAEHALAVTAAITPWYESWQRIEQHREALPEASYADMIAQLDYLIYPGFLQEVTADKLKRYPRWLKGLDQRLQQALHNPGKDLEKQEKTDPWMVILEKYWPESDLSEKIQSFHSALEDYRLSVFAPGLKPFEKISSKKLKALSAGLFGESVK